VNSLKGVSSRYLRQEFTDRVNRASMHGRFRSPSYFAGSCGGAPLAVVKQYIEQQKRPDERPSGMRLTPGVNAGTLSQDQGRDTDR
jgi:REP element-mobilizing transposase RayT